MGITDIKRVLRLYFIQQLAKDELVRSENMLDPEFNHLSTTAGISSIIESYKESLRSEASQGLERAVEIAEAYGLGSH